MLPRYLDEFAAPLLNILNTEEPANLPIYVRIESQQAVHHLKKMLSPVSKTATPILLENDLLNKLKEFLEVRWQLISGTDAIYPHQARTVANRACVALAEILSPIFKVSAYQLLMPSVKMASDFKTEHYNNFILTDDEIVVDVVKCLDEASKHQYNEFFTPSIQDAPPRSLTKLERQRVINHCRLAHDYFYSFFRQGSGGVTAESLAMREQFLASLSSSTCEVQASYHEQSHIRLVNIIISHINDIQALARFMSQHFSRNEWLTLLSRISNVDFFNILLSKNNDDEDASNDSDSDLQLTDEAETLLETILNDDPPSIDDESIVKAYLLCLLEAYMRIRRCGPDYTSYVGRYVGSLFPWATGTYSKDDKMEAGKILRQFLLTDYTMQDLYKYLQANAKQHYWAPLNDDTLGNITQLAKTMERSISEFRI